MILFVKKYHTFSRKVSYILKKVSYFWLILKEERAEGVGEETKEEHFWHRTGGNGAADLRQGRGGFWSSTA
jgi:hypothetical protein